jgi:outer membrane protein OmpA-like peptidoglycan-associated protein
LPQCVRASLLFMNADLIADVIGRRPRIRLVGGGRSAKAAFSLLAISLLAAGAGCKKTPPPASEAVASPARASTPSTPSGSLAERLNAVQSGAEDKANQPKLPPWKPLPEGASAPTIPLIKGLVVVGAVTDPAGDYEPISSLEEADASGIRVHVSADRPSPKMTGLLGGAEKGLADPKNEFPDQVRCTVLVDAADLAKSHNYREFVCADKIEHYPGTNPVGASVEMLQQLRAGQQVEFNFSPENSFAVLAQLGAKFSGQKVEGPLLTPHAGVPMYSCNLHRVGSSDVAFPVLVNDQPVELPALHAMCTFEDGEESHIYYLDQSDNPMALADQLGVIPQLSQVIKITLPPPQAQTAPPPEKTLGSGGSSIEQALAANKPVEVYGIYFDFNSATIKPESDTVLQQIAGILQRNPDWKLSVSGHTDNIGDDTFNLGLSQRRAAAVKNALVTRYGVSPDRLATSGYGASQPIESNKTMEGRARNRRVELRRQ